MTTVFPFIPQRKVVETLEWKTEVIRCRSAEQRLCLRNLPRTALKFNFHLLEQQIEAATVLLRDYGASEFLIPFWHELENVGNISSGATNIVVDTSNSRYLVGEYGFILGDDGSYETVTITTVNPGSIDINAISASYSNALVMPAHLCYVKAPFQFTKQAGDYNIARAEYYLSQDFNITASNPYPSFNSSYVMNDSPLLNGSARERHTREFKRFNNLAGPIFYSKTYTYPISSGSLAWSFNTSAELWTFRLWLYGVKGKQESFYLPRWTKDFIPSQNIYSGYSSLYIEANDYLDDTYTGAICIVLKDGTFAYTIVTHWGYLNPDERHMFLSDTIGIDATLDEIEMICRMPKVRFNSDNIDLNYLDGNVVNVNVPVLEVPE